jgi:hypothetical protein
MAMIAVGMTVAITTGPAPSSAAGAARWVARERPAGPVLTVDGWGRTVADGDRLRVVTVSESELTGMAASIDPGSVVVPSDSSAVTELRTAGEWVVTYRDDGATVLVHEGALPVAGAN